MTKNNKNRTSKALNVVAKHVGKKGKNNNPMRQVNLGSLVIAHPNLYRNPWHSTVRERAKNAVDGLPVQVASYQIPMRNIDPTLLRRLHRNGELSIALAEHEYWHPESDPRDVEYYLKHSKGYVSGLGPEEAMTLMFLNEQQQTRILKASLCGRRPFRVVGSKYTIMGETLVNLWNMVEHWYVANIYVEEEIDELRTKVMRAVLKAYRECFRPRSTIQKSTGSIKNAVGEMDRLFATPLTTNAARNRAAAGVRRVIESVPRSRLSLGAHALELAMREYERYLKTRWYVDPFLSPYADIFKTILKRA